MKTVIPSKVGVVGACPSGQTGPVPETSTRVPHRIARLNPIVASYGDSELIRCRAPMGYSLMIEKSDGLGSFHHVSLAYAVGRASVRCSCFHNKSPARPMERGGPGVGRPHRMAVRPVSRRIRRCEGHLRYRC